MKKLISDDQITVLKDLYILFQSNFTGADIGEEQQDIHGLPNLKNLLSITRIPAESLAKLLSGDELVIKQVKELSPHLEKVEFGKIAKFIGKDLKAHFDLDAMAGVMGFKAKLTAKESEDKLIGEFGVDEASILLLAGRLVHTLSVEIAPFTPIYSNVEIKDKLCYELTDFQNMDIWFNGRSKDLKGAYIVVEDVANSSYLTPPSSYPTYMRKDEGRLLIRDAELTDKKDTVKALSLVYSFINIDFKDARAMELLFRIFSTYTGRGTQVSRGDAIDLRLIGVGVRGTPTPLQVMLEVAPREAVEAWGYNEPKGIVLSWYKEINGEKSLIDSDMLLYYLDRIGMNPVLAKKHMEAMVTERYHTLKASKEILEGVYISDYLNLTSKKDAVRFTFYVEYIEDSEGKVDSSYLKDYSNLLIS